MTMLQFNNPNKGMRDLKDYIKASYADFDELAGGHEKKATRREGPWDAYFGAPARTLIAYHSTLLRVPFNHIVIIECNESH